MEPTKRAQADELLDVTRNATESVATHLDNDDLGGAATSAGYIGITADRLKRLLDAELRDRKDSAR